MQGRVIQVSAQFARCRVFQRENHSVSVIFLQLKKACNASGSQSEKVENKSHINRMCIAEMFYHGIPAKAEIFVFCRELFPT